MYTSVDVLIGNDSGQTKIADFYREILMKIREKNIYIEYIVADKNVGGLQISVDDMSMVHIVESANHLVPTAMEGQEKAYVISLMTSWDKCFLFEM